MQSGDLEDTVVPRPRTPDQQSKVYVLFEVCPSGQRISYEMDSVHRSEQNARNHVQDIMNTRPDWGIWLKYEHQAAFPGMNSENHYTILGQRNLLGTTSSSTEGRGFLIEVHSL